MNDERLENYSTVWNIQVSIKFCNGPLNSATEETDPRLQVGAAEHFPSRNSSECCGMRWISNRYLFSSEKLKRFFNSKCNWWRIDSALSCNVVPEGHQLGIQNLRTLTESQQGRKLTLKWSTWLFSAWHTNALFSCSLNRTERLPWYV